MLHTLSMSKVSICNIEFEHYNMVSYRDYMPLFAIIEYMFSDRLEAATSEKSILLLHTNNHYYVRLINYITTYWCMTSYLY